jgi:acyl-CoA hydrolase
VQYLVNVYANDSQSGSEESVFTTTITYVCLDDEGKKKPI